MTDLPELSPYRSLKDRSLAGDGLFVVEGPFLVERMLASDCRPHSVLCLPEAAARFRELAGGRCPVFTSSREELARIVGYPFHRGALGCGYRPPSAPLASLLDPASGSGRRLLLLCPDLNDDANLGSILRSAAAFGASGVLLGSRACDPYSRRALRLSMGASFFLPIARIDADERVPELIRAAGYAIYGAANRPTARPLAEVEPPSRLVVAIGNEGEGLDAIWLARCDLLVRIPMAETMDSLNAGVAAGIILYALSSPSP